MSTTPQSDQPSQPAVQNEAPATAAPANPTAPTTKTVVVTTRPPLIPNESANAYCLSRRNMFDAVIAILLVIGIIYFVTQWRQGGRMPFTGLTRAMNSGTAFGTTTTTAAKGFGTGARGFGNTGKAFGQMGTQIAGAIKRFFK